MISRSKILIIIFLIIIFNSNIANAISYNNLEYWEYPEWVKSINLDKCYNNSKGVGDVKIAILDTGINTDDICFKDKILKKYNVIEDNYDVEDKNGHGTFVASICAGNLDKDRNIYGVCPTSKLIIVKVVNNENECTPENLAKGIRYSVENGANIINISLGTYIYSDKIIDSVDFAISSGCIIVASVGNDGSSIIQYPSCIPGVLSVGASDIINDKSYFSNYGANLILLAPGTFITGAYLGNQLKQGSGTSISTPIVSGLCSILMKNYPNLTSYQIEMCIRFSCNDLKKGTYYYTNGRDIYSGFGIIDAFKAFNYAKILSSQKMFTNMNVKNNSKKYKWYNEAYLFVSKINLKVALDYEPEDKVRLKDITNIMTELNICELPSNSLLDNDELSEFVTRENLVKIVINMFGIKISDSNVYSNIFSDFDMISSYNKKYITYAYQIGLVEGMDINMDFRPKEFATCSQLFQILYRIYIAIKIEKGL